MLLIVIRRLLSFLKKNCIEWTKNVFFLTRFWKFLTFAFSSWLKRRFNTRIFSLFADLESSSSSPKGLPYPPSTPVQPILPWTLRRWFNPTRLRPGPHLRRRHFRVTEEEPSIEWFQVPFWNATPSLSPIDLLSSGTLRSISPLPRRRGDRFFHRHRALCSGCDLK